jgi:hypothetical protein
MSDDQQALDPLVISGHSRASLDALIERWWRDHFPGSAVARDTAAWNAAHSAKEALKGLLDRYQCPPEARVDVANNDLQRSI